MTRRQIKLTCVHRVVQGSRSFEYQNLRGRKPKFGIGHDECSTLAPISTKPLFCYLLGNAESASMLFVIAIKGHLATNQCWSSVNRILIQVQLQNLMNT